MKRRRAMICSGGIFAALWLLAAAPAGALEAGDPAPTFQAAALGGGKPLALAAYHGKVVYLDFWASWCPPCLVSLPLLEELRQEFPAAEFQVLAVNVDRDPERARAFLRKLPVGYPSAADPEGQIPERFGIETMPTSFLIDGKGVIRHVHPGFRRSDLEGLRKRIVELLAAEAR